MGGKGAWRGGEGALGESIEEGGERRGSRWGGPVGRSRTLLPTRAASRGAPWWRRRCSSGAGGAGDGGAGGGIAAFAVARPAAGTSYRFSWTKLCGTGRSTSDTNGLRSPAHSPRSGHLGHARGTARSREQRPPTARGETGGGHVSAPKWPRAVSTRSTISTRDRLWHAPASAHLTNRASVRCPRPPRSVDSSLSNIRRRRERLTPMSWRIPGSSEAPGSSHP